MLLLFIIIGGGVENQPSCTEDTRSCITSLCLDKHWCTAGYKKAHTAACRATSHF